MNVGAHERGALRALFPVARDVLADMDPDDVPARLRKVARSSARQLPPPLEKALVDGLIGDDGFRGDVAERWLDSGSTDEVISAFLDDPAGAIPAMEAAAARERLRLADEREERLTRRIEELRDQLTEARTRLADARAAAEADLASARESDKAARSGLEASLRRARRETDEARDRAANLEVELERARAAITSLEAQVERLARRELRRREQPPPVAARQEAERIAMDPLSISAALDAIERRIRPYRGPSRSPEPDARGSAVSLPLGVAPDVAEAVDEAIAAGPDRFILDGYNIGGAVGVADFTSASGRAEVERLAGILRRAAGSATIVVFDALGVEGRPAYDTEAGVVVRFARDRSADDEIVAMVGGSGTRDVVVTNDRDLRTRVTTAGALALWGDALRAWLNR